VWVFFVWLTTEGILIMGIDKLKNAGLILLFAGNLIFFASAYYFHQDHASLEEQLQEVTSARDSALSEKVALQAEITLLQNRLNSRQPEARSSEQEVSNLERLLNLRDEELQKLKQQLDRQPSDNRNTVSNRRDEGRSRRGGNMQERMERLKEENPEEYERMQNRIGEFQRRREEQTARRELFFKKLDVSKLNSEQRRTISEYQELLVASEEMANRAWQGGEQANFQEMMEQGRAIREMSGTVREILLQNLDNQAGARGDTLGNSVQEILEITSMGGGNMGGGGNMSRGGGGGGGRFQGRGGRQR
jgi:chromosome segregation ATPase